MGKVRVLVLTVVLIGIMLHTAQADVVPGDVISSSNYQKIQGLVPDYVMDWVKKGDLTMKIGKLNCNPGEFWPPQVVENWKTNIGKYKISDNNGIVDAKTGKPARNIKGLPFPEPDTKDPKLPVMLMYNEKFREYVIKGPTINTLNWFSISRRGLEKNMVLESNMMAADPGSEYDLMELSVFKLPMSVTGTGTLALYCLDPAKEGMRFIYTPDLRKIRRMAARMPGSNTILGMDSAPDDFWAGGERDALNMTDYKFIGEKEALVPYVCADPEKLIRLDDGSLQGGFATSGRKLTMGYEDKSWKGAPWHFTNIIWVKSKVYIIESKDKDRNYSYGVCEGWIEKGTFIPSYKRITDLNGKFWKGNYYSGVAFQTQDGKYKIIYKYGNVMVDSRRDHGSAYPDIFREGGSCIFEKTNINRSMFTKAGFEKFTK
jgi:hypothetical protein